MASALFGVFGGGPFFINISAFIQGVFIALSGVHQLSKAEIFLIALLANSPERKMKQATLKEEFTAQGYTDGGDLERIYARSLDSLVAKGIIAEKTPYTILTQKIWSLPRVKKIARPEVA